MMKFLVLVAVITALVAGAALFASNKSRMVTACAAACSSFNTGPR
jgi:hypothetical protein